MLFYVSNLFHSYDVESFFSFFPRSLSRIIYATIIVVIIGICVDCLSVDEKIVKRLFLREKTSTVKINHEIGKITKSIKRNYKIDIKSLNNYIYKSLFDNYDNFFNHLIAINAYSTEIKDINQFKDIQKIILFKEHLTNLFESLNNYINDFTIIFTDIKERKEFYCLLCFFEEIQNEDNLTDYTILIEKANIKEKIKITFLSNEKFKNLKKNLGLYFIQEKSEIKGMDDVYTIFNYYYSSENEIKMFGEFGKEKNEIKFGKYKFKVEYLDDGEVNELKKVDPWDVLWN